MSKEKKLVPKLRFPEFSGEWENKKLGEIAKFSKGKNISKSDISDEGIECIRYGELYTHYSELIKKIYSKTNLNKKDLVLSKVNDVIIPASGETAIDISTASCIQKSGIALSGDINIIRSKENGIFLSYYFNNKKKIDIARLAQGISVIHLYTSQLSQLNLNLPSLPEQEKIASFLSKVNEKIEKLERKKELWEEYKKGVMQKIFSREIRFKDDEGQEFCEWEGRRLENILSLVIDNRGKTPPIEKEGIHLIEVNAIGSKKINYNVIVKYVSEDTYNNWFRKYLKKNDILFSTVGATAIISIYKEEKKSAIAQNIVGLRFKKENPDFMYYLLSEKNNNNKFKRIEMVAVQPSVKVSQMIKLKFLLPSLPEQEKISNFLSNLDTKIDVLEREIERNKEFKRGLLQGLFV